MRDGRLYYLASPYSSPDPEILEVRFRAACAAAGFLLSNGIFVFSPIAHTHPIACECELPKGFDFWERYDTCIIGRCDGLIILTIEGWRESTGVAAEIAMAEVSGKPVYYFDMQDSDRFISLFTGVRP